jgi:hypothetical protein
LNEAAQVGLSEDGVKRTQTLRENFNNYSGSLGAYDTHSFNREILLDTRVFANQKKHSNSSPNIFDPFNDQSNADCPGGRCSIADKYIKMMNDASRKRENHHRITRQCKIVAKSVFETERKKTADATEATQKI